MNATRKKEQKLNLYYRGSAVHVVFEKISLGFSDL